MNKITEFFNNHEWLKRLLLIAGMLLIILISDIGCVYKRMFGIDCPGMVLLLNVLTCGIYQLFWMYSTSEDLKYLSNRYDVPSGITAIILTLVTCGFYQIYWYYKIGSVISDIYHENNLVSPVSGSKYLVLFLVGLILSCIGIGAILVALLPLIAQQDINNLLALYELNNPYQQYQQDFSQY